MSTKDRRGEKKKDGHTGKQVNKLENTHKNTDLKAYRQAERQT